MLFPIFAHYQGFEGPKNGLTIGKRGSPKEQGLRNMLGETELSEFD